MHEIPDDINFDYFIGCVLIQVAVGKREVQLQFLGIGYIAIYGKCEVDGRTYDVGPAAGAPLLELVDQEVTGVQVHERKHLELRFGGRTLIVRDSNIGSESYTADGPHGLIVV